MKKELTKKEILFNNIRDYSFITLGIFAAAFGVKGFLLPNHFIDGGVTGISLLVSMITNIPLWIFVIIINIPFFIMGYKVIGKAFAIKMCMAITALSIVLALVTFPEVTNDKLLVAIFGGFFLGAGIGLSIRGGAVIDGTEVLAIYLGRKVGATIGDVITIINVVIFLAAAYFLSIEIALYSMITYLSASKTLDFFIEGIEEYIAFSIVSPYHSEIRQMIVEKMNRGVMIYKAKSGHGTHGQNEDINIVYSIITRLEVHKMHSEIEKIDPEAFVVMSTVKDIKGGMIKQRPLKH